MKIVLMITANKYIPCDDQFFRSGSFFSIEDILSKMLEAGMRISDISTNGDFTCIRIAIYLYKMWYSAIN